MTYRALCLIVDAASLAACVTNKPGWTGSGAESFDTAISVCEGEVSGIPNSTVREAAFETCMAKRGWTRP